MEEGRSSHGGWSRKLREAEGAKWKWSEALNSLKATPVMALLQQGSMNFPKDSTSLGPGVQICEPVGDFFSFRPPQLGMQIQGVCLCMSVHPPSSNNPPVSASTFLNPTVTPNSQLPP